MLNPKYTKRFKKDIKRFEHKKDVMIALKEVIDRLLKEDFLDPRHCNHTLTGNWVGHLECHVKPDVILIYKVDENHKHLILERVGSHSDLFK